MNASVKASSILAESLNFNSCLVKEMEVLVIQQQLSERSSVKASSILAESLNFNSCLVNEMEVLVIQQQYPKDQAVVDERRQQGLINEQ